jgi:acyl-coenzyme A thioesterase PaaI-like protein
MTSSPIPFRLAPERLASQLAQFNARKEIAWFGFLGAFEAPGRAVLSIARPDPGMLGGGGQPALNGGVIAAGFDGAFVLAGLGQYETEVVVTLELSVKFLDLATASRPLAWRAHVVRSSRRFAFVEGTLSDRSDSQRSPVAIASALVAPAS